MGKRERVTVYCWYYCTVPKKPSLESHTRSDYLGMSLFHVLLSRTWSAKAKGGKGRKNEFFPPSLLWHGGALLHRQTHNTHGDATTRRCFYKKGQLSPRAGEHSSQPNAPLIIPRTMPHRRQRSLDPRSSAPPIAAQHKIEFTISS